MYQIARPFTAEEVLASFLTIDAAIVEARKLTKPGGEQEHMRLAIRDGRGPAPVRVLAHGGRAFWAIKCKPCKGTGYDKAGFPGMFGGSSICQYCNALGWAEDLPCQ